MRTEGNTAKPEVKPSRLVVIDRTMLVLAIACNTDATPRDAAHIINTVLYKQRDGDPSVPHDSTLPSVSYRAARTPWRQNAIAAGEERRDEDARRHD